MDQTSLVFEGKTERSARESSVIYIGNTLFDAEWRNQKILLREMDQEGYGIKEMAYPTIYNLLVGPKEEVPELNYLNDTWVDLPLYQVIKDHETSISTDKGSPGP